MLDELRQTLQRLERPAALDGSVPLGAPDVDAVLGGGFLRGALHEVSALGEAHLTVAAGFVTRVARAAIIQPSFRGACQRVRATRGSMTGSASEPGIQTHSLSKRLDSGFRPLAGPGMTGNVVLLAEDMSLAENGALYGPGLLDYGLPPERLLTVAAGHRRDLLWAMEEALRCRSVRAVIGEMRAGALDPVAVRRLSLAAAESGGLALLLRAAPPEDASTAATRWLVGAAPADRVTAHLTRNRRGPLGSWILTWSDGNGAHAQPLAAAAADRPYRAVA